MVNRNVYIGIAIVVIIAVAAAAYISLPPPTTTPSSSTTSTSTTTTSGPPPEDTLIVYTTVDQQTFTPWQKAFEAKYPGTKITFYTDTPGNIFTKIVTERAAHKQTADVVMISLSLQLSLQNKSLLEQYNSPEAAAYPAHFKDSSGHWVAAMLLPMLQVRNTNLVPDSEVPRTMDQLVDPKWKGKDTIHDLTLGTVGTQYFATLKQYMGEKEWTSFMERLATNVQPTRKAAFEDVINPVASGEKSIALSVYMHDYLGTKNKGAPVASFTIDGLPVLTSLLPVGVVSNATHPVAAKLFMDWILSKDGQTMVGNSEVRIPARQDINAKYMLKTLLPDKTPDDLKIFPNDDAVKNNAQYKSYFAKTFTSQP
ncbi:MAG: extracellular solute-binding protein [Thaumarchaeota archaeon]|nr:extracellular solute-binding protein [Nitrososphaerota archaeon]MCL5316817.1 extracellular solute-binding protein [Nitrososphaerota archaeon]